MSLENLKIYQTLILVVIVTIIGCRTPESSHFEETSKGLIAATISATHFSNPTSTTAPLATVQSSRTPSPTPTLVATNTQTPEPTIVHTSTPTIVPVPTLTEVEAEDFLIELFLNNVPCRLPCWWDSTPGETIWQDVQIIYDQLGVDVYTLGTFREAQILVSDEINEFGLVVIDYILSESQSDGIVNIIEVKSAGNGIAYELSTILMEYGPPDEIWLSTYSISRENTLPFRLIIVYEDEGILATYGDEANLTDGTVTGCIKNYYRRGPNLTLWDPKLGYTFHELMKVRNAPLADQPTIPIKEATGLTVDEFYDMVISSEESSCLTTPANMWD